MEVSVTLMVKLVTALGTESGENAGKVTYVYMGH